MERLLVSLVLLSSLVFGGCATNQGIVQLTQINMPQKEITIVNDGKTRQSVQPVVEEWFTENNFKFNVVESLNDTKATDDIFTYRAFWSWDISLYMARADMKLIQDGTATGIVKFDAHKYGAFGKFGSAAGRLKIMMDALFSKITEEEANKLLGEQ